MPSEEYTQFEKACLFYVEDADAVKMMLELLPGIPGPRGEAGILDDDTFQQLEARLIQLETKAKEQHDDEKKENKAAMASEKQPGKLLVAIARALVDGSKSKEKVADVAAGLLALRGA